MDHKAKFLELCGMTSHKEYREPQTASELLKSGEYYLGVFDKVSAQGELHLERVQNELSRLLAEGLQHLAREKYGVAGAVAIRQVLIDNWNASGQEDWESKKQLFKTVIDQMGLNPEQEHDLSALVNVLPDLIADFMATEAARMQLIPLENVNELVRILAEMIKEKSFADQKRNN